MRFDILLGIFPDSTGSYWTQGFVLLLVFFFYFVSIVTEICHISNCTEYFLQVFNFAFLLMQSPFRHRIPPCRAPGLPVLTRVPSTSSGKTELDLCIFPVQIRTRLHKAMGPSSRRVSLKSWTLCSISNCFWIIFVALGSSSPTATPGLLQAPSPLGSSPDV